MAKNHIYPQFTYAFIHPRYWLTWLGLGLLYLLVQLPYPFLRKLGFKLGLFSRRFLKRRVRIAECNLRLCFPEMSAEERKVLLDSNFAATGMALFETGMAWFWSDKRIKKWCDIQGLEHIQQRKKQGQGVILVGIHFLTLELGARILGIYNPGVGVYRPHNNKVMDWMQTKGRLKSNKYMLARTDVKGMIRALKEGELLWYAPDHDYGAKNSVFAPFFAVEKAATTIGTSILMRMANPALIPFTPKRKSDGSGYLLTVQPPLIGFPMEETQAAATFLNKAIEKEILSALDQYMWLHRRFKTRPEGEDPLYD